MTARTHARSAPAGPSAAVPWNRRLGGEASPTPDRARADDSRLLTLAESVGDMGHWRWNPATDKLTWSDQVFVIHGVDPAAFPLTFAAALETVHPDDRGFVRAAFDDARLTRAAFELDFRIARGGGVRTVICKGQPELDAMGRVTGLYGVLADVTDAFAAIRAIHDQKEMLGLAAHLAHLGHWIWSEEDDRLAFCSEELARIHGLSPEAMEGFERPAQFAATAVPGDRARYLAAVTEAIAASRPYDIEYRIESAGGVLKDIREIGQPIVDEAGRLRRFVAAVQDISEAKRRELELDRAREELRRRSAELHESNRAKDKLFSIIAHDLRSPFNTVMGFSDLLAASAGGISADKAAGYARIVRDSAADVQTLLDNLLTWASIQIRDSALKLAPVSLSEVSERSLGPLRRLAREKQVTIENTVGAVSALGDAELICIVLRNLVSNGIKFSRAGGTVRIGAAPDGAGGMLKVTVRDDGVGMSPAAKADLFALKCATSEPGTHGEKGTGLGLYLCRDIVARHGGAITVDSRDGGGTAIHFTLPLAA